MKYTGHRAIQATIHSPALQSSEFKSQLHILFIPLVSTLANSSTPLHCIAYDTQDAIDISVSAVNNSTLDISDIERLAAETISAFFNKLNGPSVRMSLVPLFEYMNKEDKWWPPNLSVDIMKLILNSLQPQYRYLLVSDILHNLDKMKYEDITARDAALTMIVNDILNANISLLGISVLEVLNSLFTILTKSAQHYPFLSAPSNETHGNYHYIVQDNLILSISGLASQPYYDNQLNDMIGYLMSKLRANTSLEIVDNIALHSYRVIVLTCLDYVIKGTRQAIVTGSSEPNINLGGYKVFLDTWNPALPLLCDKNSETRIAFCNSLDDFLRNAVSTVDIEHPNHTPQHALRSHQHDALFVECLLQVMYDWIQRPDFGMMDLLYFYSFLCLLVRKFNVDATIVLVPFMFKIQQLLQNNSITVKSRQLALFTVVIQWFMFIADVYHIQSLSAYMDQFMKDLVKRYPHISHLDLQERVLSSVDYQPFMDNSETKPLNIWLERGEIVEAISKEGGMRDPEDIHGLELESKLFSEWGPKLIIKQDRNSKHLIPLQEPKSIKAKLASPWKDSVVEGSIEDSRKDSIRVENLKEALATPAILNEEDKGESSSSQSTSLNDSQYRPMPDMNALLNELSTSKHDQSTVSLVNPPYKL
ncbi:hypothetical protein BDB01DRAFT_776675 [Pilobolus umbonatus]|nr:hypothetical protein BDB01DRAFT_776675 [Pilobolus umbonatus]